MPPTEEGDVTNKSYVGSKSVGESDLNMNGNLIKNVGWAEKTHNAVNRAYVHFVANSKPSLEGGEMTGDINLYGHSVRHTNPAPIHEDEVVPKQWIANNFLNRYSPASSMARDLNMDGNHVSYLRDQNKITTW